MASIINAATSGGLITTADTSGILNLQTAGTTAITVDGSQNVGIGTTSPYRKFQVGNYSANAVMALGSSPTGTGTLVFSTSDSAPGRYVGTIDYNHTSNYLAFTTNASEGMRIDSSGNLGINQSTPAGKLHVVGATNNWTQVVAGSTTSTQSYGLRIQAGTTSADFSFLIRDATNATDYLTVTGNGNVGVGTSSPTVKFQTVQTIADWTGDFKNYTAGAYGLRVDLSGSSGSQAALQVYTATGSGIIVKNDGLVGIGTFTPYRQFQVGNYSTNAIMALGSSPTGTGTLVFSTSDSAPGRYVGSIDYNHTSNYLAFTANASERMRIDSSGNLLFNSGYGSVATAYGCRAWVNFNGTGTVAIRGSANVSSLTDNGAGNYSVNYTTAMPDANYAGLATCRRSAAYTLYGNATFLPTSTSAGQVCTGIEDSYSGEIPNDSEWVHVAIFR